jgi:hypothetical protein
MWLSDDLEDLIIIDEGIGGTLPEFWGMFRLAGTNFLGGIPEELFTLPNLVELDLSNSEFTGPLSPSFSNLAASLQRLHLDNNGLTGTVPGSFGALTNLSK